MSALGEWLYEGLCVEMDPGLWFPGQGGSGAQARRICSQCPVQRECLDYAVTQPEVLKGVWGGLTEHERRQSRRQLGRAA